MKDFSEKFVNMVILATFQHSIFSFFQIEPVGDKRLKWTPEEPIECPTEVCFINKTNHADRCLLFIEDIINSHVIFYIFMLFYLSQKSLKKVLVVLVNHNRI